MKGKYDRLRTRYLKYLILFVVSVVIFIAANIQSQQCGYQICYARYTMENGYSFKNFQVCGMKDRLLEKKVNERLNSCFHILSDKWFGTDSTRLADLIIHCQTERYLSVEYVWDYYPAAGQRKTYENLKAAYEEVDFVGTFRKGAPEVYDLYKEKFRDLIRNRLPIVDKKTG